MKVGGGGLWVTPTAWHSPGSAGTFRVQQAGDTQLALGDGEGLVQVLQVALPEDSVHVDQHRPGTDGHSSGWAQGPCLQGSPLGPPSHPTEAVGGTHTAARHPRPGFHHHWWHQQLATPTVGQGHRNSPQQGGPMGQGPLGLLASITLLLGTHTLGTSSTSSW